MKCIANKWGHLIGHLSALYREAKEEHFWMTNPWLLRVVERGEGERRSRPEVAVVENLGHFGSVESIQQTIKVITMANMLPKRTRVFNKEGTL